MGLTALEAVSATIMKDLNILEDMAALAVFRHQKSPFGIVIFHAEYMV